eukprot:COSAG01_NODE_40186_length_466_cov_5.743869_2_plen_65_part_00
MVGGENQSRGADIVTVWQCSCHAIPGGVRFNEREFSVIVWVGPGRVQAQFAQTPTSQSELASDE